MDGGLCNLTNAVRGLRTFMYNGTAVLGYTVRFAVPLRSILQQYYETACRSLLFVGITMFFIGMVGVYQAASQAQRIVPEYSALGAAFVHLFIKEMGPIMAGLLLATRAGTSMAAEIGTMKITDQLDAMKMCGVDPVKALVAPRILAGVLAALTLAVFGCMVSFVAGAWIAQSNFGVDPHSFLTLRFVRMHDAAVGLIKCGVFGFVVPLICCTAGMLSSNGAEGVGKSATNAVVFSSFATILLDATISYAAEVII